MSKSTSVFISDVVVAEMFVLRENSPTNSRRMPLKQPVPQQGEGRGRGGEEKGKGLAVFHLNSCTTKNRPSKAAGGREMSVR